MQRDSGLEVLVFSFLQMPESGTSQPFQSTWRLEVLSAWTSFNMHNMHSFASTRAYYKINCCCGIIQGQLVVNNWGWAEQSLCDFVWFTFLMLVAFFQKALHLSYNYFPYLFIRILMDWSKILQDPVFVYVCARCMHIALLSYGCISLSSQQKNLE